MPDHRASPPCPYPRRFGPDLGRGERGLCRGGNLDRNHRANRTGGEQRPPRIRRPRRNQPGPVRRRALQTLLLRRGDNRQQRRLRPPRRRRPGNHDARRKRLRHERDRRERPGLGARPVPAGRQRRRTHRDDRRRRVRGSERRAASRRDHQCHRCVGHDADPRQRPDDRHHEAHRRPG